MIITLIGRERRGESEGFRSFYFSNNNAGE